MTILFDTLWRNANIATMTDGGEPYGMMKGASIGVSDGNIAWIGDSAAIPPGDCTVVKDCAGKLVTPGIIDCHTHLIYAGNRSQEFELRLQGASYETISRQGGGINATVAATRSGTDEELYESALQRVAALMANGVTMIEIKSGYGLDTDTELRMLRVGRLLNQNLDVQIKTTFLGAHAIPPEFSGRTDDYITLVCEEMIPMVAQEQLADTVDAFCEKIAFSPEQVERVFQAAIDSGLAVKCHAEQLSNLHGAALASQYGAISVDHLEHLDDNDVKVIANAGTVAVLLPGAFYFLRETKIPPVESLRRNGVPIAVASDANPGSSPVYSMTLMLSMACNFFGLTPEEALAGATRNSAKALDCASRRGTLEPGKAADMVLWDVSDPVELTYRIGGNPCNTVMTGGNSRSVHDN